MRRFHEVCRVAGFFAAFTLIVAACAQTPARPLGAQPGDLAVTVSDSGLSALSYNGQTLLAAPDGGTPRIARQPAVPSADTAVAAIRVPPAKAGTPYTLYYAWGSVTCSYRVRGNRLMCQLTIHNASRTTLTGLTVQLMELDFPSPPFGTDLDAGQFGTGGSPHPLSDYPSVGDPQNSVPLSFVAFGANSLAFCSDNPGSPTIVSIPFTTNPPAKTRFPLSVTPAPIRPGESVQIAVSLRFGPRSAGPRDLADDVIRGYARTYPYRVQWADRRPIGELFLSTSSGIHTATNPRGWFNEQDIDVKTPVGIAHFRERLLRYADESIKVLRDMDAQGMITWDPEGQEFSHVTYYGDPRLTEKLSPETAFAGPDGQKVIDAYFKKFRDAGFRVGVCIRPQEIHFVGGTPQQDDSPDPAETLKAKIAYAAKRWGCTLFYIDSTVKNERALDADVFEKVHAAYPDVLLMPENETLRDYAYAAPLNSFQHHGVTATPPGARAVYPKAFSDLIAAEGDVAGHRVELLNAVRNGDILLFHGWWPNPNNAVIKSIYDEAKNGREGH
jgi:hypothetical protein